MSLNVSLSFAAEALRSLGPSPSDRLQVPPKTYLSPRRVSVLPSEKKERLVLGRGRSLEFQLCEFVLFISMVKGDEIATATLNRLSSQLAELFCRIPAYSFESARVSLNYRQIQLLREEFVDLSKIIFVSDTISLTHLTSIGLDLKDLVQSIRTTIHSPPRFFARKMRALAEAQDFLAEEGPRRKRQKTDQVPDTLEISLTAPSGETEVLLSFGA